MRYTVLLNNIAYTLLGILICIVYYQVRNWWSMRRYKKHLPPLSPAAFVGTFLIVFALMTTIFQVNQANQEKDYRACQADILQHNITVQNDGRQRTVDSAKATRNYLIKFHALVHQGQHKHPNVKRIISQFDSASATAITKLNVVINTGTKLQPITACGKPPK